MTSEPEAVEALTDLGLTEYQARCFVALTQLSEVTAKEISQVADIPQSRVYDVADHLYQRGLVDIQESEPRRYFALPYEVALEKLRQDYDDALDTASQHLASLQTRETDADGVWEIANRQDVTNRILMHVTDADEEVYLLVGNTQLLEEEMLDQLADVSTDGVAVYVEVPTASARDRTQEAVPDSNVVITDLPLEELNIDSREPGRLMMIDRETILMSALKEGLVPDETDETGLWGTEVGHGLVVWLRPLLVDRLQRLHFDAE